MADYVVKDSSLTAVADAIREKTGDAGELIFPSGFTAAVLGISGGEGGGGFADSNLVFAEHTVTIGEGNGVENFQTMMEYLVNQLPGKNILAYSLIGFANTYNQAILFTMGAIGSINKGIAYRYRDGYVFLENGWAEPANYTCVAVVGSQYKVYTVEYKGVSA